MSHIPTTFDPMALFSEPLAMPADHAMSSMNRAIASMHGLKIESPVRPLNIPGAVLDQYTPFGADSVPYHRLGPLAIVQIEGPMWYSASVWAAYCSGGSVSNLIRTLGAAGSDQDIKAVALCIHSPGGEHHPLSEIADAMRRLKAVKPIHTLINNQCHSQGYLAASLSNEISAVESGACGSIGTISFLCDSSEYEQRHGFKWHAVTSGSHKALGGPGQAIGPEELARVQSFVDRCAADFASVVVEGRSKITTELIEEWDGRIFYANEMLEYGLVDRIESEHAFFTRLLDQYTGEGAPSPSPQGSNSNSNKNTNHSHQQSPGSGRGDHTMKLKNMSAEDLIKKLEEDETVDNELVEKAKSMMEEEEPENNDETNDDPENSETDPEKKDPENTSKLKLPKNTGGTPATFNELEDIVPSELKNRDSVITEMLRNKTTTDGARSYVQSRLVNQLNELSNQVETDKKARNETQNTTTGRQPLRGGRGGGGGGSGSATQAYENAVNTAMKEHGIERYEAVRLVRNEQPAVVQAYNDERNEQTAAR